MLGVTPASSFKNQVATPAITMRSHPTGPAGVRAMAIALVVSNSSYMANIYKSWFFVENRF